MIYLDAIIYAGIFTFALAGTYKAHQARLDLLGGVTIAFVSAYGGGTLRDVLLGVHPINWMNNNLALLTVLSGVVVAIATRDMIENFKPFIFFFDAIGLGLFTAVGIEVGLRNGANELYALLMGVMTATFGGVVADILCGYRPILLRKGELYASICIMGGAVFIVLNAFQPDLRDLNLSICVILVAAIRIYAVRKHLSLPEV